MSKFLQFNFPTTIHFGPGARTLIGPALRDAGAKRVLFVTDKALAALPMTTETAELVRKSGLDVQIFSGVEGNPVESQVTSGTTAVRDHKSDAVIAFGGGAAMDVAKAVALMAHHPGTLFDYEDRDGAAPVDKTIPLLVTVPTTAGTGSEVGRSTVISDDATHSKKIMFSPRLMPARVFADPELTLGLPAGVTAATGMDALTHLIESYLAKGFHPICEGVALQGIRLVKESLILAVRHAREKSPAGAVPGSIEDFFNAKPETHLQARGHMLLAAIMGGIAFQKGLGVNHSCAHALSTVVDMHHGLANGIMLPYTMEFNLSAAPERFRVMSEIVHDSGDRSGAAFVNWTRNLQTETGIPVSLKEAGVSASHLDTLVDWAVKDACHPYNCRPVSREDFVSIFKKALG